MIPYHGGDINPVAVAVKLWTGRHGLISFARPYQVVVVAEVCLDFVLDNGAFSAWQAGKSVDWNKYYAWIDHWRKHPGCSWALIPDVIDGSEEDNDRLVKGWPHGVFGVPVWHLHESLERLHRLCSAWSRVAIGSSGKWSRPGSVEWWGRMAEALDYICDAEGRPLTKLHGLRMMNPDIFMHIPFASVDSSTIARKIGRDSIWTGAFQPKSKQVRALVLADRFEANQSAPVWRGIPEHRRVAA